MIGVVEFIGDHFGVIQVSGGLRKYSTPLSSRSPAAPSAPYAPTDTASAGRSTQGGANLGALIASGKRKPNVQHPNLLLQRTPERNPPVSTPFTGFMPNKLTDIDVFNRRVRASRLRFRAHNGGGTDTGVHRRFSSPWQNRDLGTVSAFQIRARPTPYSRPPRLISQNSVGSISTSSTIDGLSVTTGPRDQIPPRIRRLPPGHEDRRPHQQHHHQWEPAGQLHDYRPGAPTGNIGSIVIAPQPPRVHHGHPQRSAP